MATSQRPNVILDKGKSRLFKDGNPIIYGGAVKAVVGNPSAGSEVDVSDHQGNVIGRGFFNPHSQYRVRIFVQKKETGLFDLELEEIIRVRVERAISLRRQLLLPSMSNTVYRLINGEGDRLGGLIVDVFNDVVVVQSSALWVEKHNEAITHALRSSLGGGTKLVWRRAEARLAQDGFEEAMLPAPPVSDPLGTEPLVVLENGLKYLVSPEDGQKTGFYCDQRENRLMIASLSKDKDILDAYCYSGGFSVSAAAAGASSITAIDSSAPAIAAAVNNLKLNQSPVAVELVKADAVEYMQQLNREGKSFDIVICDPPKLAPTRTSLVKAKNKYIRINTEALRLVRPGGLLFTCTCSAAVTQTSSLRDFILEAAQLAGRDVTILASSQAARDHPVHASYEEGAYLTGLLCGVS